jgi:hexosaminidase
MDRPPGPARFARRLAVGAVLSLSLGGWTAPHLTLPSFLTGGPKPAPTVNVIPAPASVQIPTLALLGGATVADGTVIAVETGDHESLRSAEYLQALVARTRGVRLDIVEGGRIPGGHTVILLRRHADPSQGVEAYDLDIGRGRIIITAAQAPGLFYGAVTLWQLLTPDDARGTITLKPVHIADAPRFAWRGLMLDSARHYQSPEFIKQLIDVMALHKLNTFHWHLTDDQAWRLQIPKYPRLTEVGAWRVPAGAASAADIDPATGKPRLYGGFYTQDQVREIVAYAAARQITIVPEIEMPGHALSAILAYPELGSNGLAPASIQSDWGVFPYLYNADDHTFGVLDDVLTEVMDLFPGRFIHVGGDEATKDQWRASPKIQARMKALGITDEDALQSYFTHRIGAFLDAHGRRLIGWDEILNGGPLPGGATVMSWRGIGGAITAAKAGHDTVLAPAPTLYFDNRQGAGPEQPPGRGTVVSLRDVYAFDPAPSALTDDQRRHILGVQANLWTEHVRTDERAAAMIFPRLSASAEVGWSPQAVRDWTRFTERLPAQMERYRALGVPANEAATAVTIDQSPAQNGGAAIRLSTQIALGDIRYTTDGAAPGPTSTAYAGPFETPIPTHLRAAAFKDGRTISPMADAIVDALTIRRRTSQQLKLCAGKLPLNLEDDGPIDGPRAAFLVDILEPCWTYEAADLTGISSLAVSVGQLPFNFQIGADRDKIVLHSPRSPQGELDVRLDSCAGELIASLPLAPATASTGVTTLTAPLPPHAGKHDLCFTFTSRSVDPMWAVNWVQLIPGEPAPGVLKPGA